MKKEGINKTKGKGQTVYQWREIINQSSGIHNFLGREKSVICERYFYLKSISSFFFFFFYQNTILYCVVTKEKKETKEDKRIKKRESVRHWFEGQNVYQWRKTGSRSSGVHILPGGEKSRIKKSGPVIQTIILSWLVIPLYPKYLIGHFCEKKIK